MCKPDTPKIDTPTISPLPAPIIPDRPAALETPTVKKSFRRATRGLSRLRIPLSNLNLPGS